MIWMEEKEKAGRREKGTRRTVEENEKKKNKMKSFLKLEEKR